ncbi:MetQ/NlpA family ABC transporter substrate-binding protein [Gudongella sp. DL1XJH-153]|uniref:MetQ/NlpA family ABC transporter substrate-binding protein n=1 Tax=Gudongella sp. DL1XJH-153 TaxID=3409804 RepID=UPI003BB66033
MKKVILILTIFVLSVSVIGCSSNDSPEDNEINVGVAFYPMKDILLLIEDDLEEEGYDLKIHEFADYQAPNNLLDNEELDANMIQHDYFLQSFNESNNSDLVTVQPIYHAIFALYSRDYESVEDIPEGSTITLPDDATNLSRALYLLGQAELLTFKDNKTTGLTIDDIETNPKGLKLDDKVPLTSLAQRYTESGLATMYPTYARSLELVGDEQRLYVEKEDSVTEGYAISLVAREDNKDSEKIQALINHITSDEVRQFLIDEYSWASNPAF